MVQTWSTPVSSRCRCISIAAAQVNRADSSYPGGRSRPGLVRIRVTFLGGCLFYCLLKGIHFA